MKTNSTVRIFFRWVELLRMKLFMSLRMIWHLISCILCIFPVFRALRKIVEPCFEQILIYDIKEYQNIIYFKIFVINLHTEFNENFSLYEPITKVDSSILFDTCSSRNSKIKLETKTFQNPLFWKQQSKNNGKLNIYAD